MDEKSFLSFLNSTASRKGAPVFNLNTLNTTRQARDILNASPYKVLAKQHINASIAAAYTRDAAFRDKLDEVMSSLNITVVAPANA